MTTQLVHVAKCDATNCPRHFVGLNGETEDDMLAAAQAQGWVVQEKFNGRFTFCGPKHRDQ